MCEERITVTVEKQRVPRLASPSYVQQRVTASASPSYVQQRVMQRTQRKGEPVLCALREGGIPMPSLCGLAGRCGRCMVRFIKGAPLPTQQERAFLSPERLRQGYRLACLARPVQDCVLETAFVEEEDVPVLTESFIGSEREEEAGTQEREENSLALAADLGTTTIAMQLLDKRSGRILDTFTCRNPQGIYGEDVISRIRAGTEGQAEDLRRAVTEVLEKGIRQLVPSLRNRRPEQLVIAANTAMAHLLLGHPVESLGKSPFAPSYTGWAKTALAGVPAEVFPGISAFVGGDVVSGLYACGLEAADLMEEEPFLFLDLGTNAEMALGVGGRLYATAAAAGPAFAGAVYSEPQAHRQAASMRTDLPDSCTHERRGGESEGSVPITRIGTGAERIQAVSLLLKEGTVDGSGVLKEPYFEKGIVCGGLFLTQKDIREIQMAKAAVRAGIHFLKEQAGLSGYGDICKVWLSGGFGFHLDREAAAGIGLLPAELMDRLFIAGNTSLAGARRFALTKGKGKARGDIDGLIRRAQTFNLAGQPDFQGKYIGYMNF